MTTSAKNRATGQSEKARGQHWLSILVGVIGVALAVALWRQRSVLERAYSNLPEAALAVGLSLALLLTLTACLAYVNWRRAKRIEATNQQLEGRITVLKRVRNALREQSSAVRLLEKVAVSANESTGIGQAMRVCIAAVCADTRWSVGHAYIAGAEGLIDLSPAWSAGSDEIKRFKSTSPVPMEAQSAPANGLIGRVLASGKPSWVVDAAKEPGFRPAKVAEDIDVKSALVFPVMVGTEVGAVLEFFSAEIFEPDYESMQIMTHVGAQLGRVIERERAREKLKQLHDGLEHQVAERTTDLRSTNDQLLGEIRQRKKVEEVLTEKSALLEATFESMSQGITVYDAELRLLAFNQRYIDLFDFADGLLRKKMPLEEVLRFQAERGDFGPGEIEEQVVMRLQARQRGEIVRHEFELASGANIAVAREPLPNGGYVTTYTDITRPKRAEEALRASEERIRMVMDNLVDRIIVIDEKGNINAVNPAGEQMFGYRREEMLGRNVSILLPDADEKQHQSFIDGYRRNGGGKIIGAGPREVMGRRKDGTTFPMDIAIGEIRIGDKAHFVGTARDITLRKQAEAEKSDLETQIRHFQKLEALGTLTGGIAHEFNNLLLPMLTLTELAMDDIPEQHEARDNLEKVLSAGNRAKILVQQISDYSRDKEPPQGPVELQPIVDETLGLLRTTLPATVEIRVDLDAAGAKVCADPSQIHQILMNLSSNAADALDGKVGVLEFRLHRCVAKTTTGARQPHLKLVIQDTGAGMDDQTVKRIFDPFYTTKEVGSGTGMGLAIVDSIVAAFGGMIKVKSAPGQGTAFEILIPLWTENDEADSAILDAVGRNGNAGTLTVQG